MRLTISSKGWVVIPADLRKKYGLKPGDTVNVVDYGGVLALVPALADPVREAMGMLKGSESLTEALLEERRKDREREERKWG
jgi:AbrB family looped-hinge helix DNA binding protein